MTDEQILEKLSGAKTIPDFVAMAKELGMNQDPSHSEECTKCHGKDYWRVCCPFIDNVVHEKAPYDFEVHCEFCGQVMWQHPYFSINVPSGPDDYDAVPVCLDCAQVRHNNGTAVTAYILKK